LIFMGGTPIGSSLLGIAAQHWGIRPTIVACGVITTVAATLFLVTLGKRGLKR